MKYRPKEIKKNIYYVGVNDRNKNLFENLWPLPKGVSYNSFLIEDEKITLIDTVDVCYSDLFFRNIKSIIGEKPINYLVVNHMEPDHSGAIEWLVAKYPNIQIIGNSRTADMLKGYYGVTDNVIEINDEDEISIGRNTLRFYLTPMVHWPETMMTYIPETHVLFSGDAFGSFGTLDGGILDTQLNPEWYEDEMIRYYSNIVGKYGSPIQAALKKLSSTAIETICSTHGPIWTTDEKIAHVTSIYDKLSRYEAIENGLVVAYGSMYGHTEQLAEIIGAGAADAGLKNIVLHNVSKTSDSEILRDIFKYNGLIIGSPTYNNKLYPGVENLISAIQNRNLKNRFFSYFGGFTWAGAAAKHLKEFSDKMEFELICSPVEMKQSPDGVTCDLAYSLGTKIAERILSNEPIKTQKIDCH